MGEVMKISAFILCAFSLSTMCAHADIVYLSNGGVLEGKVRYEGDKVIIEQPNGWITIAADKIDRIETKNSNVQEFDERFDALVKRNAPADDFVSLAQFAASVGMNTRAEQAYKKAIAVDPDNAAARQALGFEKFQGQWMTSDDANAARGLIKHNGVWVTPAALQELLKKEKDIELVRVQLDLKRAQAEVERLRAANLDREVALQAGPSSEVEYDYSNAPVFFNRREPEFRSGGSPTSPVAPPQNKTPPPTHSFGPIQVPTPPTLMPGSGGSISTHHR